MIRLECNKSPLLAADFLLGLLEIGLKNPDEIDI